MNKSIDWLHKITYIIFINFALINCSNDISSKSACIKLTNNELNYSIKKSLAIPVNSLQYNYTSEKLLETDSATLYAGFDNQNHEILLFDLNKQKLVKTIKLSTSGPDVVEEPSAFYYHNKDSIFIARYGYFQIYLISIEGIKINEWSFLDKEIADSLKQKVEIAGTYGIGGFDQYGIDIKYIPKTKKLIGHIYIIPLADENTFPTTYKLPFLAELNLRDGEISKYFGQFPANYQGETIPHDNFFSYNHHNERITISFLSSSQMQVISPDSSYFVCASSSYINVNNNTRYDITDAGEVQDFWEDYRKNASYNKIIFDSYRNKYYRVVKHDLSNLDSGNQVKERVQSEWSIIVMDNDYNIEGEVLFPSDHYDFMSISVLEEGILLKKNLYSSSFNEDLLQFDIVTINE